MREKSFVVCFEGTIPVFHPKKLGTRELLIFWCIHYFQTVKWVQFSINTVHF